MDKKKTALGKGQTNINITKKKTVTINRHGQILEEKESGADSKKEAQEARAKKLGFK